MAGWDTPYGPEHTARVMALLYPPGCTCQIHYFAPFGGACGRSLDCPVHGVLGAGDNANPGRPEPGSAPAVAHAVASPAPSAPGQASSPPKQGRST